jgi:hypothetical protein
MTQRGFRTNPHRIAAEHAADMHALHESAATKVHLRAQGGLSTVHAATPARKGEAGGSSALPASLSNPPSLSRSSPR